MLRLQQSAKFLVHESHLWSRLHDGWHYGCCKLEHNLYFLYIPYGRWAVPLFKLTNKNVCLIVVFCKACWVRDGRSEGGVGEWRWGILKQMKREGERKQKRRRQRRSLVHSLSWLTARREGCGERKGGGKGRREIGKEWACQCLSGVSH